MNILILTCNTGGGHNAVAAALTEAFRRCGADCTVLDGLSFISQNDQIITTMNIEYFPGLSRNYNLSLIANLHHTKNMFSLWWHFHPQIRTVTFIIIHQVIHGNPKNIRQQPASLNIRQ